MEPRRTKPHSIWCSISGADCSCSSLMCAHSCPTPAPARFGSSIMIPGFSLRATGHADAYLPGQAPKKKTAAGGVASNTPGDGQADKSRWENQVVGSSFATIYFAPFISCVIVPSVVVACSSPYLRVDIASSCSLGWRLRKWLSRCPGKRPEFIF